ncbi:MAG: hypothetical protein HC902_13950 [Calothrix sp. SM1_5_4]|nr:hypothetical protein [Calothrix sp. SM1_5_4]
MIASAISRIRNLLQKRDEGSQTRATQALISHGVQEDECALGIPRVIPVKKLNALVEYLNRQPHVERLIFGLMASGLDADKSPHSYWIGLVPVTERLDVSEVAGEITQLWNDVLEEDPDFPDHRLFTGLRLRTN